MWCSKLCRFFPQSSVLAIFKVDEEGFTDSSSQALEINPICHPDPARPTPSEGVMSGWASPLPLFFFERFLPAFLPYISDTYKQWHYKLGIGEDCSESTTMVFGATMQYPSKAYFPPGTICAKDRMRQLCPTAGESGSPLMVKNSLDRYYIEGVLSFHRGCQDFTYRTNRTTLKSEFTSYSLRAHLPSPIYCATFPGWRNNLDSLMKTTQWKMRLVWKEVVRGHRMTLNAGLTAH